MSTKPISSSDFDGLLVGLCWSLWTELGVRGVTRHHQDWSIDPEALVLLTAGIADHDPRLRDESLDWCIRFERQLSRVRLRSLSSVVPPEWREAFGSYAATASQFSRQKWPATGKPFAFEPTGKSSQPQLDRPSLIRLRLRAVFGMSARAEILHALLANPQAWVSAAELARVTAYSKRSVLDELDGLERAAVVETRVQLNRRLHQLRDPKALYGLIGSRPRHMPNWVGVLAIASRLALWLRTNPGKFVIVRDVAANTLLEEMEQWDEVALPSFPVTGPDAYARLSSWADATFSPLATGTAPRAL